MLLLSGLSILWFTVTASVMAASVMADQPEGKTFPEVFNTEPDGQQPPAADEMVRLIDVPPGFNVTLFAGDPEVQQPICMDFDDRGRLWVVENYTYSGGPYEKKLRDRVVIFEDKDGDGRHDGRRVFWDEGFMTTSLTWGFGGLWILQDGTLSFIPDRDGDDVPDSEPVVMLDGWSKDCGHNFVSGLIWGPDGWLYGRHGIVDTSWPGVPGTPKEDRPFMNCGIWRFHPVQRRVEVVCHGTTNPWGLDYNDDGQFFMTNNVQGHLWHVIPGAHFQRMYGQDFNPHAYELMQMTADHYHWDTKAKWTDSRDGKANDLGGGHSHVGALIYHGQNFPAEYRGKIFMCNTHGRRINVNRLDREGSGYVGRSEPDFMLVKNPWFRGVDIKMGPEGAMYVADWSDNGECHDHDGIHRTSGRIYRIAYGTPLLSAKEKAALSATTRLAWLNADLMTRTDWFGRHARRIRQELVADGEVSGRALASHVGCRTVSQFLHTEAFGGNGVSQIEMALASEDPLVIAAAVQTAAGDPARFAQHRDTLNSTAHQPQSAPVLLSLASVLQRLEADDRWKLASAMLSCPENAAAVAAENQLALMTWYGIEPVVFQSGSLELLSRIPKLQNFAVRRLASQMDQNPVPAETALRFISTMIDGKHDADAAVLLNSFRTGLAGRVRVRPPESWVDIEKQLRSSVNPEVILGVDSLGVLFGDGAALADLRALAGNVEMDPLSREHAIRALGQAKDTESLTMFFNLLGDRAVYGCVITTLAEFDHPMTAKELISRMAGFKDGNRSLAIDTMASREIYALDLMDAIREGRVEAHELTAGQVRQLIALGNPEIKGFLEEKWGVVQETPEARLAAIEKWRNELTAENRSHADLENGAVLFRKACASCHRLFSEGKAIAPDLTGANRTNLEYLLMNIVDPGAVVPKQFTTSVINLKDGRVITGVVVSETDETLVVQTDKEQLTLVIDGIEDRHNTGKSLMPDGLLDSLTPEQVRDLFGYVMQQH